ncbi:MAG: DUF4926 domain-containing protein [Wenzhouxiangella sp.]|nr:MAG: DUF4926 domain-containing protein [Wenzhouxiangella sp.]
MSIEILDTVVLSADIPEKGLKRGDVGAIVEVYADECFEVEFVAGSGQTVALVTLPGSMIHPIGPGEMLAVRELNAA